LAGGTNPLSSADALALIHQTSRGIPGHQQPRHPVLPRRLRRQTRAWSTSPRPARRSPTCPRS